MTQLERREKVLRQLDLWNIPYTMYTHPPLPTVEIALEYWKDVDATHCKNLFMRNHKGNRHYLVVFECHHQMAIHDIEKMLHQGKLSFASEARMEKYLGLLPGSVSPFGLINDTNREVKLFLDKNLQDASLLSFHPNDNTADLVVTNEDFMRYLTLWGGEWEYLTLY
ncbi:MAG: prolyl-tRNA synthetase associated domain-containing protein [Bacteroidetes bacterium]|uniref:Prolyl-tRNA synthetase associated domain-containing protein n=1 Tax=Candidatus Egerieousia excrementavium TaxID=2840778 RepID=A0A9D9DJ13_9BACT|nr:prolyl-tRNA synthetase associated domain-containing protein [Candidatus Egerieousia excrementavium]